MNKAIANYYLRVHPTYLTQMNALMIKNVEDYIKAKAVTYGILLEMLSGNIPSSEFSITELTENSLSLTGGYCVYNLDGEVLIFQVNTQNISLSAYNPGDNLGIYIVPKKSAYEQGLLNFTNNSKVVTFSDDSYATFNNMEVYDSILIETSIEGNDGIYRVETVNPTSVVLTETFLGTTESGLKWKIIGYYGNSIVLDSSKTIYEYDAYDLVLSTTPLTGIKLNTVLLDEYGHIERLTDNRLNVRYKEKGISDINSDSITQGSLTRITTRDERRNAAELPSMFLDILYPGSVYSVNIYLTPDNLFLEVEYINAYDYNGNKITGVATFDLVALLAANTIKEGNTYLTISRRVSHDVFTADFQWRAGAVNNDEVCIGILNYDPIEEPSYTWEYHYVSTRFIGKSFISNETLSPSGAIVHGELAAKTGTDNLLHWYFGRDGNNGVDTIQLMDYPGFIAAMNTYLSLIRKEEFLRFSIMANSTEKAGWFMNNGIAAPAFVGYAYKLVSVKLSSMAVEAISTNPILVTDYIGLGDPFVNAATGYYVPETVTPGTVVSHAIDTIYPADHLIGMYFDGVTHKARLVVGEVTVHEFTINEGCNSRIYHAEINIQSTEEVPLINSQT